MFTVRLLLLATLVSTKTVEAQHSFQQNLLNANKVFRDSGSRVDDSVFLYTTSTLCTLQYFNVNEISIAFVIKLIMYRL